MDIVKPGIYRHFKGKYYQVLCVAADVDTARRLVVYADADGMVWSREIDDFMEPHPHGQGTPRFCLIREVPSSFWLGDLLKNLTSEESNGKSFRDSEDVLARLSGDLRAGAASVS